MITESKKRDVALVVDDSPETLRLLTDALDGAGMTVMVAMDGAAAMRIVDQITPDIILLDAVMPGMDGFETCRRLKREAPEQRAGDLHDRVGGNRAHRARP
jgi:DNA-binding response OmpR family regulator